MGSIFRTLTRAASRLFMVPSLLTNIVTPRIDPNKAPIPPNNQLNITHQWNQLDLVFPSDEERLKAIDSGDFVQSNVIPFGIDVWEDRIFLTLPKLRDGIPITLATVPRLSNSFSPSLQPYPNWDFYKNRTGCMSMISVFRTAIDPCGRLWVLDSGKVNAAYNITQQCPPQIFIFDLVGDRLLRRYVLPQNVTMPDNLFTNIVVDYQGDCQDVYAYMADTKRYNLVVYSYKNKTSWNINHGSFYPDPMKFNYQLDGVSWYWNFGLAGLALGPMLTPTQRKLYYYARSSYKQFSVPTSVLKNPETINENRDKFVSLGERGYSKSHATGAAISRTGVLFYGLSEHHVAACWDTNNTDFSNLEQGVIGVERKKLAYPNDVKVDHETNQSVWILNNNLHQYLYGTINSKDPNFRILRSNTETAVERTVCSPTFNLFRKYRSNNRTVNYETTSVRTEAETAESSSLTSVSETPISVSPGLRAGEPDDTQAKTVSDNQVLATTVRTTLTVTQVTTSKDTTTSRPSSTASRSTNAKKTSKAKTSVHSNLRTTKPMTSNRTTKTASPSVRSNIRTTKPMTVNSTPSSKDRTTLKASPRTTKKRNTTNKAVTSRTTVQPNSTSKSTARPNSATRAAASRTTAKSSAQSNSSARQTKLSTARPIVSSSTTAKTTSRARVPITSSTKGFQQSHTGNSTSKGTSRNTRTTPTRRKTSARSRTTTGSSSSLASTQSTTTTTTTTTITTPITTTITARSRGRATRTTTTTTAIPTSSTTRGRSRNVMRNMIDAAGRMVEDCRDLPIGPEQLRPCNVVDRSRNTVNRLLSQTPVGDILNNGALENAIRNNPVSNAVDNTINNVINPVTNVLNNTIGTIVRNNPIAKIINNNPFRRIFG